ncbi:zinc finger BED domain-containing 1-like protein [Labeo rohita]|uniref:Zinc finger BED domain-containing 1-like protein n=1 Tax=Labeo rohita TaxID=84645 RepID=A0A498L6U1_LABRO|nr:zinc finger BED domain-containing 1-like protein [Labeo rohita]
MKLLWERALLRQCGEEGERLLLEWDAEGMVEVLLEARIDAFWSQVLLPDAPGNSFPVHHHCIHLQVSPEGATPRQALPPNNQGSSVACELESYYESSYLDSEGDPLKWWKEHEKIYKRSEKADQLFHSHLMLLD